MNKKEKLLAIDQRRRQYQVGTSNYKIRSLNAIHINSGSTVKHEMAKSLGAYMIRKWGDIKFTPKIIDILTQLDKAVKQSMSGFPKQANSFITEVCPKCNKDRRIDLVNLDTEDWIEFETDHKIKKQNSVTVYI